jgi:hypothetical protein
VSESVHWLTNVVGYLLLVAVADDRPKTTPAAGTKKEASLRSSPLTSPRSILGFSFGRSRPSPASLSSLSSPITTSTSLIHTSPPPLTLTDENHWLRSELARVTANHADELRRLRLENEHLRAQITALKSEYAAYDGGS